MRCRQTMVGWLGSFTLICLIAGISLSITPPALSAPSRQFSQATDIVEVSPPEVIQKLRSKMDRYQPQVNILSPAAEQLLKDDSVSVRFDVKDLPLFKDTKLGLGPHLSVLLDNQPAQEVYDLNQPLVFKDLAPGTHTIRAVATRPWSETFKNSGAFAQTTFHVFTKTEENNPAADQPLLTYGQPQGVFGSDTVLIDFFLSNVPETGPNSANWQAQVSVNGSKFRIDEWQPLYVQGLKPGKNWVQMQLTDRQGRKIDNAFNDTIRIVELKENGNDTLSQIVRGDLSALDAGGIVDANYKRPQPPVKPAQPSTEAVLTPAPDVAKPKSETPKPEPVPAPVIKQPVAPPKPKASTVPAPKSAPTKSVAPSKSAETKSPETQKKADKPTQSASPAQKAQKSADQTKEKASSSAPAARTSVKKDAPVKAKGTEPDKSAPVPAKPPASDVKAEKKSLTPEPPKKSASPSAPKQPQPKPAVKSPVIEKTAPKPLEKSAPSKVDNAAKSTAKTAVPKQEAPTISPTPATKARAPEPAKDQLKVRSSRPEQPKPAQQEEDSTLKTTFTKFWQQVRPTQEPAKPSTSAAGDKVPTKGLEARPAPSSIAPKKEEPRPTAPKPVEPKTTPSLSAPASKQPTPSPKPVQPPSTNQRGTPAKAKNSTTPPSQKAPAKPQAATSSKSPSSQPKTTQQPKSSAGKPKATESSSKPDVSKPEKPQAQPRTSVQKSEDSNTSVFSGFRDRLKQLQKNAAPAVQKPSPSSTSPKSAISPSSVKLKASPDKATAPAKATTTKPTTTSPNVKNQTQKETAKPSVESKEKAQPSALSTFRDRWQQQKQMMSPGEKIQTPVKPAPKKAPGAVTTPPSLKKVSPAQPSSPGKSESKKPIPQSSTPKPSIAKPTAKDPVKAKVVESKPASPQSSKQKQTDSVFSSLRDKWQQQMTSGEKVRSAPVKPASPKVSSPTNTAPKPSSQTKVSPARPSATPATQKKPSAPSSVQKPPVKDTVKAKPAEAQSAKVQPAKPNPTDSVFSSLRDRWQQQKQLVSPAEQTTPTPVKTAPKKATGTTSAPPQPSSQNKVSPVKPSQPQAKEPLKPVVPKSAAKPNPTDSVFSSLRSRWQQEQSRSKPESKTAPSVPKPTQPKPMQPSPVKPNSDTQKLPEQAKSSEPARPRNADVFSARTQAKRKNWFQPSATQKKAVPAPTSGQKPSSLKAPVPPSASKTLSPKVATPPASPSQSKVSSSSPSIKKTDTAPPKAPAQPSETKVFDPGEYYRRFFPGKTMNTPPASANPVPSP